MIAQRRAGSRELRLISEISITPALSLVLVLLLAFLIACPFLQGGHDAASGEASPAEVATLVVDASRNLMLDDKAVGRDDLNEVLRKRLQSKPETGVLVRMPADLPAQFLVDLMESLKQAGVSKTAVTTAEK